MYLSHQFVILLIIFWLVLVTDQYRVGHAATSTLRAYLVGGILYVLHLLFIIIRHRAVAGYFGRRLTLKPYRGFPIT